MATLHSVTMPPKYAEAQGGMPTPFGWAWRGWHAHTACLAVAYGEGGFGWA